MTGSKEITTRYTTSPQTEGLNFEAFSRMPEYREVNRNLLTKAVGFLHIPDGELLCIVDVATGTGLVPQELIGILGEKNVEAEIYGIDPDEHALDIARRKTPIDSLRQVTFIKGKGQEISTILSGKLLPGEADWVSIHDAIQEMADNDPETHDVKQAALNAMAELLRPDGILTMNSAFTKKSYVTKEGSVGMAWGKWTNRAHQRLGIKWEKTSLAVLEPEEYKKMITVSGLKIIHEDLITVNLSREALIAISHYPSFINGAISGSQAKDISLEDKSQALVDALNEGNVDFLPRTWFEVIARKV